MLDCWFLMHCSFWNMALLSSIMFHPYLVLLLFLIWGLRSNLLLLEEKTTWMLIGLLFDKISRKKPQGARRKNVSSILPPATCTHLAGISARSPGKKQDVHVKHTPPPRKPFPPPTNMCTYTLIYMYVYIHICTYDFTYGICICIYTYIIYTYIFIHTQHSPNHFIAC